MFKSRPFLDCRDSVSKYPEVETVDIERVEHSEPKVDKNITRVEEILKPVDDHRSGYSLSG